MLTETRDTGAPTSRRLPEPWLAELRTIEKAKRSDATHMPCGVAVARINMWLSSRDTVRSDPSYPNADVIDRDLSRSIHSEIVKLATARKRGLIVTLPPNMLWLDAAVNAALPFIPTDVRDDAGEVLHELMANGVDDVATEPDDNICA